MIHISRALLQECWFILFQSTQFTCYLVSKLPDAIMIPSGILAKITAAYLLQSL